HRCRLRQRPGRPRRRTRRLSGHSLAFAGCRVTFDLDHRVLGPPRVIQDYSVPDESGIDSSWTVAVRGDASSALDRSAEGVSLRLSPGRVLASYDPRLHGSRQWAIHASVAAILRRSGRLQIHAAAVVPPASDAAILLCAGSGHG